MISTTKCKFCEWTNRGHGNSHFSAHAEHLRKFHPEQHLEKQKLVEQVQQLRRRGRDTFGQAWSAFH